LTILDGLLRLIGRLEEKPRANITGDISRSD